MDFLDMTSKAQRTKGKINWTSPKLETFELKKKQERTLVLKMTLATK